MMVLDFLKWVLVTKFKKICVLYKVITLTHCIVVLIKKNICAWQFLYSSSPTNLENDLFGLKKSGKNQGIALFPGAQQPWSS